MYYGHYTNEGSLCLLLLRKSFTAFQKVTPSLLTARLTDVVSVVGLSRELFL
uniref:Uncharacterized protein n=1 Tax=Anguilla anguilla TaxID=7936 RepID=A0A0E9RHF5_ANGAN